MSKSLSDFHLIIWLLVLHKLTVALSSCLYATVSPSRMRKLNEVGTSVPSSAMAFQRFIREVLSVSRKLHRLSWWPDIAIVTSICSSMTLCKKIHSAKSTEGFERDCEGFDDDQLFELAKLSEKNQEGKFIAKNYMLPFHPEAVFTEQPRCCTE